MSKYIVYIGNNLTRKTKYNSTIAVLSSLLKKEGFKVVVSSDKINKIVRLGHMCFTVIKYRNKTNFMLVDTFSTSNFYFSLITTQLARIFKIKYIPILHGGNLPERITKHPFLSKLIFKNSYKNIAPSLYLKKAFEKEGYKTYCIPNVLEIEKYQFKKRALLSPKVLWVRAFKKIYNPTMAIEVLQKVKVQYPAATLCMVGPTHDASFENVKALVSKYNLNSSVSFTGVLPKEKWHELATEFDIFINTTNFDNTPVSVMEAMALGLPVISTNVGGIPYLINDKEDGILVQKNNATEMANQVIELIKNERLANSIQEKALQKVTNFSWHVVKQEWFKVFNK